MQKFDVHYYESELLKINNIFIKKIIFLQLYIKICVINQPNTIQHSMMNL